MAPIARPYDADPPPRHPGLSALPDDGADIGLQDFNSFFEKLSNLDDARWHDEPGAPSRSAPPAGGLAGGLGGASPAAARPRNTHSAAEGQTAPAARASQPTTRTGWPGPRRSLVPLMMKMTLTAAILFGLGMGAGWLALSLPKTSAPESMAETPLQSVPALGTGNATAPATIDLTKLRPAGMAMPSAAPAQPKAGAPAASPAQAASAAAPKGTPVQLTPVASGAGQDEDDMEAFKQPGPAPARPMGRGPAQGATLANGQTSGGNTGSGYSVQVGACSSSRCVETYRTLIQPLLNGHSVQVMEQPVSPGAAAMQRVRVEGLTIDEAESLKQTLEQADPRLKGAYIVRNGSRS